MKKRLSRFLSAALILVCLLSLPACGAPKAPEADPDVGGASAEAPAADPEPSGSEVTPAKELSAYIAWGDDEIPTYANAFEAATGIKLNYVRLSAGEMVARLMAEKENPQASVVVGGGSENYIAAAKEGLFTPYQSPELANIPQEYHEASGNWSPVCVSTLAMAVNTDWFRDNNVPYPESWDDILDPVFKGMILMAHPSTSGVSSNLLSSMAQWKGDDGAWEYFGKLKENIPYFSKASSSTPSGVSLGEAAIGVTVEGDALKYKVQGYPVDVVIPDPTFLDVNAVAIVSGISPEQEAAAKIFVDWILSVEGQETFIDSGSYRLPINSSAKASDGMTPLSDIHVEQIDRAESGARRTELIEAFSEKIEGTGNLK